MFGKPTREQRGCSEDNARLQQRNTLQSFDLDLTLQEVAERLGISEDDALAVGAAALRSPLN